MQNIVFSSFYMSSLVLLFILNERAWKFAQFYRRVSKGKVINLPQISCSLIFYILYNDILPTCEEIHVFLN